jgi:glycosyltransferase involved in cell wall biosynthesis
MDSAINVLHLSTHNEECGIAAYQESITDSMGNERPINNVFFDISPNKLKLLKGEKLNQALQQLMLQLKDFDILHIQHEYSFYNDDQLQRVVDGAKAQHKKVLFTLHTPPHARKEHAIDVAVGLHPRSWVHAFRNKRDKKRFLNNHIEPLKKADLLLVLSQASKDSFEEYGVPVERMKIIELPVPPVDTKTKSTVIAEKLHKKSGDIILSTAGFIAKSKGTKAVLKALAFLPENYKLAIIGGAHHSGLNDKFYDEVSDTIRELSLQDRVYITGYVAEADQRDALLRETDICLYPYDRRYYDYVSSAALNNAIANGLPIVAYKTYTFEEANNVVPFINFCQSPNYYELVRTIQAADLRKSAELTTQYAEMFTIEKQAELVAETYTELAA